MRTTLALLLAALATGAALAFPSFTGSSGLAALPSPKVMGKGQVALAGDYRALEGDAMVPLRISYGLGNHLEVSGAYTATSGNDTWAAGVKYRLPHGFTLSNGRSGVALPGLPSGVLGSLGSSSGSTSIPRIEGVQLALGAQVLGGREEGRIVQPYLSAGHVFTTGDAGIPLLTVIGGVNYTHVNAGGGDAWRGFGGASLYFTNGMVLSGEIQSKDNDMPGESDPLAALTLRYPVNSHMAIEAGVSNADGVVGTAKPRAFAGVSLAFGGQKSTKQDTITIPLSRTKTAIYDQNGNLSIFDVARQPYGDLILHKWW
jgi:hypothetical protein